MARTRRKIAKRSAHLRTLLENPLSGSAFHPTERINRRPRKQGQQATRPWFRRAGHPDPRRLLFERLEPRVVLAAEIDVLGNAFPIADGDATPRTADGTDFGTVDVDAASTPHRFTVRNAATQSTLSKLGVSSITLTGADQGSFRIVASGAPARLSEGASITFDVVFDPASKGAKRAQVVIANSDLNEDPYNFDIVGVAAQGAPEIVIFGPKGREILDGDDRPSTSDGTDVGNVVIGGSEDLMFRITNQGTTPLLLTLNPRVRLDGGSQAEDFQVIQQPSGSIPPNSSSGGDFVIQFTPSVTGQRDAIVTIKTNDTTGGEDIYTFRIRGNGTRGVTVQQVGGGWLEDGGATAVDLGSREQGTAAEEVKFVVTNATSTTFAKLDFVTPTWVTVVDPLADSIAPNDSDEFSLKLVTTGVFTRKLGDVRFTYRTGPTGQDDFSFQVAGEVSTPAAPVDIGVTYEGREVEDASSSPLQLGAFPVGQSPSPEFKFTVRNRGSSPAVLKSPILPAGFSLVEDLAGKLEAGDDDTFAVRLDTSTQRSIRDHIRIGTNDSDTLRKSFDIAVSARVDACTTPAPDQPLVCLNSHHSGSLTVGDTITIRGFSSHASGISHVQVELYQGGITAANRVGIIYRGNIGDGNRDSVTWTVPPTLDGHVLGGTNYKIKWVAWNKLSVPVPAADFSDGSLTIQGGHAAAPEFITPWDSTAFSYYANRSFFYDQNHLGADVALAEGTPIRAGVSGRIKWYDAIPDYGTLAVVIEVDLGETRAFTNAYGAEVQTSKVLWILGHLRKTPEFGAGSELTWDEGDIVKPSDPIGYIEHSSHPDGQDPDPNGDGLEHLHLGLRLQSYADARTTDAGRFARGYENPTDMGQWFADPLRLLGVVESAPQQPRGLSARALGADSIEIGWGSDTNAKGYRLFRSTESRGPWTQIYIGSDPQYRDANDEVLHLDPSTPYYYYVQAFNSLGDSVPSAVVSATTNATYVPTPTAIAATASGFGEVTVEWEASGDIDHIAIERRLTNGSGPFAKIATVSVGLTSFTDAGALLPEQYSYRVRGAKQGVLSLPSPIAVVQVVASVDVTPGLHGAAPVVGDESLQLVKFHLWDFETESWGFAVGPNEIPWSDHRNILLTHGWDDDIDFGSDEEYVEVFAENVHDAKQLMEYVGRDDLSNTNIVAVDWSGRAVADPNLRKLGSNPNGKIDASMDEIYNAIGRAAKKAIVTGVFSPNPLASMFANFATELVFGELLDAIADAQSSANNAISIAGKLAPILYSAGLADLANVMLVGHSNGAGFMGQLAIGLNRAAGGVRRVAELVALDAPWMTRSCGQVYEAAPYVSRVSNYYIPMIELIKTGDGLFSFDLDFSVAFGAPVNPSSGNVANYKLSSNNSNELVPGLRGHSQVPMRYAQSARPDHLDPNFVYTDTGDRAYWGFKDSPFVRGRTGDATSYVHQEYSPVPAGSTAGPFYPGADINSFSVNLVSSFARTQLNAAMLSKLLELLDASEDLELAVGERFKEVTVNNFVRLYELIAESPTFVTTQVPLPANAQAIDFRIDVFDSGNRDVVEVGLNGQLLTLVDLESVQRAGGSEYRFWINEYAGQTVDLSFNMPSDGPSDAHFAVSNIEVITSFDHGFGPELVADPLASSITTPISSLTLEFDEPIDETVSLAPSNYQLTGPNGAVDLVVSYVAESKSVILTCSNGVLSPGDYTLSLPSSGTIVDLSGDPFNDGEDYEFFFTVVEAPRVEGTVWIDESSDGVRQGDEPTSATPVTVHLIYADGTHVVTATTGANGVYTLTAGLGVEYRVEVELPPGYRFSDPDQGGDDSTDSDVNVVSGRTPAFTFTAGGQTTNFDAGLVEIEFDGGLDLLVASGTIGYAVHGAGDGSFAAPVAVGATEVASAIGDFNEDGAPDIVFREPSTNQGAIRFGLGNRQFSDPTTFLLGPASVHYWYLEQADINNDGHLDLMAVNHTDGAVHVHNGNGDGTFQPYATYAVARWPRTIAAADFNADGWLDLVTPNNQTYGIGDTVSILMNEGDGTFAPYVTAVMGDAPRGVAAADFNGDGLADIATSNQGPPEIAVRLSLPGGGFGPVARIPASARNIAAFDIDGDSDMDLATAGESSPVTVLLNDGNGNFTALAPVNPMSGAFFLAAGDFNNDGRQDLVVTHGQAPTGNNVAVMFGDGTGGFSSTAYLQVPNASYVYAAQLDGTPRPNGVIGDLVWRDLNGDGLQDPDEPGMPDVQVALLDSSGSVVGEAVTDVRGYYEFDGLAEGSYEIVIAKPDGYVFSPESPRTEFPVEPETIALWHMNGPLGASTKTEDAAGNFPLRLVNNVTAARGFNGADDGSFAFDGGTAHLQVDGMGGSVYGNETTIEAWVRMEALPQVSTQIFCDWEWDPYKFVSFGIGADGRLSAVRRNGDPNGVGDPFGVTGTTVLQLGQWYYVAATMKKYEPVRLYVNGQVDGESDKLLLEPNIGGGSNGAQIGNINYHGTYGSSLDGFIDEVRLSSVRKTSEEIADAYNQSFDSAVDPATGRTGLFPLAILERNATIDAGLIPLGRVDGRVWADRDGDGLHDIGEVPESGLQVDLVSTGGAILATTTTDEKGRYAFTNLTIGDYAVEFSLAADEGFTLLDQGDDDSVDSDVDRVTGRSAIASLANWGDTATFDAGLITTRFVGDRVWEDLDADGVQDLNEPAIDQVRVEAFTAGDDATLGTGDDVLAAAAVSDSYGAYHFADLADGQYRLVFTPPAGYFATLADVGEDSTDSDIDPATFDVVLNVAGLHEIRDLDAGFYQLGTIAGQKWNDLNGNGIHDADEPGLNGWTIELTNNVGESVATAVTPSVDLDGNGQIDSIGKQGRYSFAGLVPGVYHVQEVVQQGWLPTYPLGEDLLLADDFNDNAIDSAKWTVTLPLPTSSVVETGQRLEFTNRGYLISTEEFDPIETGLLRITGRWQHGDGVSPTHDQLQILTRSDGVATGNYGETANGIEFRYDGSDLQIVRRAGDSMNALSAAVPLAGVTGEELEVEVLDDGRHLRFTMTRLRDGASATVEGESTEAFAQDHVVIHNRENDCFSVLDDFRLSVGGMGHTLVLQSGETALARDFGNQALPGQAPVVDLNGENAGTDFGGSFTENDSPVAIAGATATVTDADTLYLEEIVATITNWADGAVEQLTADLTGTSLTASYTAGTLIISGPAAIGEFQQVLRTLKYANASENPTPGQRTIQVYASDGRHVGPAAVASVDVAAVNDAPTAVGPQSATVTQGDLIPIAGLVLNDVDLFAVELLDVTLTASAGTVELSSLAGLTVLDGENGSSSLHLRGVLPDLNAALATLAYVADDVFFEVDTLVIGVDDAGQFGSGGVLTDEHSVSITVIDETPPIPILLSPADGAVGVVSDPVLAITFSEAMRKGAGEIVVKLSDGTVVESINVAGTAVSISGTTATIVPAVTLSLLTDYYVEVTAGAFEDLAGNDFAGFSGPTAWNFTTEAFRVTGLLPNASGFAATLSGLLETTVLNLYDGASVAFGAADVVVLNGTGQSVAGSIMVNESLRELTWVATGGVLPPGMYTVTLRSGDAAFRDVDGHTLDGDADGASGGDFLGEFTVAATDQRVVSVSDIARGAGQTVNVPAAASGWPIRISDAQGMTSLLVDFVHDPALLSITGAVLAAGMPADWSVVVDLSTTGVAHVTASGTTALAGTDVEIVRLTAAVPSDAPYGAAQAIRLENVTLNGGAIAAVGDVAVHKAVYLGDADGSGVHSSADAFLTVQAALGLATGFAAHAWTDPRIVGDADGSGVLSAADAFLIVQEGLGLSEPFVPDNPQISVTPVGGGVDPQFRIDVDVPVGVGGVVSVPVKLDIEAAATNVGGVDFELFFDSSRLTIDLPGGVLAGVDTEGWAVSAVLVAPGQLRVGMVSSRGRPLGVGVREIARLEFHVAASLRDAVPVSERPGYVIALDIEPVDPRAGGYSWTAADGSLLIGPTLATDAPRHVHERAFSEAPQASRSERSVTAVPQEEPDWTFDWDDLLSDLAAEIARSKQLI